MSKVHEAREKHNGQGCTIVLDESAYVAVEELAFAEDATAVRHDEDKQSNHDLQVRRCRPLQSPLPRQDLDTFLQIDDCHEEAKGVATEAGDIGQSVARIGDGENAVHDEAPDAYPRHECKEVCAAGRDDVVDGVGEDGDGTGDTNDDERLAGENGEDDAAKDRGQEDFIDAVRVVRFGEHIETEGEGREDTRGL